MILALERRLYHFLAARETERQVKALVMPAGVVRMPDRLGCLQLRHIPSGRIFSVRRDVSEPIQCDVDRVAERVAK